MNDVDLMKCMDLAAHLGQLLGMNPVWKKECVIYGGNLDDPYIMCLSLDNGRWKILTEMWKVLNLSQEAIALMAEMSKLVKGRVDMKNKQDSVIVIALKNGVRIETDEDYTAVFAKYSEADAADHAAFKTWILSEANSAHRPPRHTFKVTDRKTGDELTLYPTQVDEMIIEEVEKPEEVVRDQDESFPTGETGSSRVTLVDGRELEVEEEFDTVNARWNSALRGENGTPVLSLTEKDSGWGLSVLAENIELVEEMR